MCKCGPPVTATTRGTRILPGSCYGDGWFEWTGSVISCRLASATVNGSNVRGSGGNHQALGCRALTRGVAAARETTCKARSFFGHPRSLGDSYSSTNRPRETNVQQIVTCMLVRSATVDHTAFSHVIARGPLGLWQ